MYNISFDALFIRLPGVSTVAAKGRLVSSRFIKGGCSGNRV